MAGPQLLREGNVGWGGSGTPIQVFVPNPALTTKLTVPAGGSVVWTVPEGVSIFMFDPTCGVKMTLNNNVDGCRYDADPGSPYGSIGKYPGVASIKFADTGAAGGTVTIEAM
jgi:hypothetical protein